MRALIACRITIALVVLGFHACGVAQSLEYSSFIGSNGWDIAKCVAIDQTGNVVVAGWTEDEYFPTTSGAYDSTHNGERDIFVAVLTADLSQLLYATVIGGGVVGIYPITYLLISRTTSWWVDTRNQKTSQQLPERSIQPTTTQRGRITAMGSFSSFPLSSIH